ncbi:hypothetical protein BHE74_00014302 [Ensete ventricosum]|nr:hypothetical protein GW17_00020832 [Ensete ventricosum]RWW77537.1 hypothetical protein BHE74_00014302 [Ensete ventricosum]
MVVVDVGEFGEEGFDPKRWINAALESRHPQDPLDRYLSDLEENLRTSADKIADALDRESADALRRVPLACRDVLRLRDDALSLRSLVSSILLALSKVISLPLPSTLSSSLHHAYFSHNSLCIYYFMELDNFSTSAESIAAIAKIDIVKQRMEAAYETLQEPWYGQMERAILSSEIAGIDIRGAVARGVGAQGIELSETVRRMEESIPQTIVFLEAAIERCINFTGGSEADELILALDDIMLQYLSNLQDTLKSLRTICGVASPAQSDGLKKEGAARVVDMVSEEEEWSIVQGALQILTVADCLTSRTSVFEASLRATLARIGTTLSLSVFGSSLEQPHVAVAGENDVNIATRAGLDVAALRLADAPDKARKLFNLLEQVAEGATALFMEQLRGIQYISDRGAQQLSADIEFLSNVLSALSMAIPPFLATFHTCLSTPRDQLPAFLKSDGGSQLDIPTAHLVCKIRRIPLDQ